MKHNKLKCQNLIVNYDARCAEIDGENIGLTHLEFSLLSYLMERKDFAISRQELLREIWELPSAIETRATDDTIKRIRRKSQINYLFALYSLFDCASHSFE